MLTLTLSDGKRFTYMITDTTKTSIYFKDKDNYSYRIETVGWQVHDFVDGSWRHMKSLSDMIEDVEII